MDMLDQLKLGLSQVTEIVWRSMNVRVWSVIIPDATSGHCSSVAYSSVGRHDAERKDVWITIVRKRFAVGSAQKSGRRPVTVRTSGSVKRGSTNAVSCSNSPGSVEKDPQSARRTSVFFRSAQVRVSESSWSPLYRCFLCLGLFDLLCMCRVDRPPHPCRTSQRAA